jgi:hypothetical protein
MTQIEYLQLFGELLKRQSPLTRIVLGFFFIMGAVFAAGATITLLEIQDQWTMVSTATVAGWLAGSFQSRLAG